MGVGISSLVSFGDKDDVSGTDMLQWWESDGQTKLALLYLESIGIPPKFARTARRVSRTVPGLTVAVGRSAAGKLLAGARAAKVATPLVTAPALFEPAGISPPRTSASCSTPRRCWPPSPCPPGPGSA